MHQRIIKHNIVNKNMANIEKSAKGEFFKILPWRRWRGSNPRYGCPYTRFRVARIQPALPHLRDETDYIYEKNKSK